MKIKSPVIAEQITSVSLSNGLRIYVLPNHRAPVVTVQVWVETGSIHEEEFLGCGLSHFLEHMLFSGTKRFPGKTEISDRANALGARLNAWTSYNHTAYYMEGPSSSWKQLADMLCDMVSAPLFPEDSFRKEKDVILRECAMRADNPDSMLFETLLANRFRNFPMRYPVIGLREGIGRVDREMMTCYYQKRYCPRRAYVVVAGDVDPQEVTDHINTLLGSWQNTILREPCLIPDEPGIFPVRMTTHFPDPMARCALGYITPGAGHKDIPALEALASILGGFDSSRLITDLRVRKPIVIDTGAFLYKTTQTGVMCLCTDSSPDNAEKACSGMFKCIDDVIKNGVTAEELDRTVYSMRTAHLSLFRSTTSAATAIGQSVLSFGSPDPLDRYCDAIKQLSVEDIRAAAERYLNPDSAAEIRMLPEAKKKDARKTKKKEQAYQAQQGKLADGQKTLYIPDMESAFTGICLCLHGGEHYETEKTAAYSDWLTDCLFDGAGTMSEEEFAWALDRHSIRLDVNSGVNGIFVNMECLRENFEEATALLINMLSNPLFPEDALARDRDSLIQTLESDRQDPRKAAFILADQMAFRKGSPAGFSYDTLIDSLQKANGKSLRKFLEQTVLSAPDACICVFGAITPAEAEKTFRTLQKDIPWNKKAAKLIPNVPQEGAQQKALVLKREQAVPVLSFPCPGLMEESSQLPLEVLRNALTGMSSSLFKNVREKEGLAYYTSFRAFQTVTGGHMEFFAGTAAGTAARVMEKFEGEQKRLAKSGLTQEEFDNAKASALYTLSTVFQDIARYAAACSSKVYLGFPASAIEDRRKELEHAELKKINRIIRKLFAQSDVRKIVVSPEEYQF
ncbi:MAG: insulinase family protein [Lentisphaeria bacterium]|nr:insulinase family protein [Lentisphaeria bacterium]